MEDLESLGDRVIVDGRHRWSGVEEGSRGIRGSLGAVVLLLVVVVVMLVME